MMIDAVYTILTYITEQLIITAYIPTYIILVIHLLLFE